MKKLLFLAAFCALALQMLNAQDIIVTKQSTRIDAKILEISDTEVRYKKASNLNGPTFVISVSQISTILFANGEVQQMGNAQKAPEQKSAQAERPIERKQTDSGNADPKITLYRCREVLTIVPGFCVECSGLDKELGKTLYNEYLSAQKDYKKGNNIIPWGWSLTGTGLLFGFLGEGGVLSLIGAGEILIGSILMPIGYIKRGVAAGKISRIAEEHNASLKKRQELSLSMSPTLLYNNGQVAPGVGLTLRF